MIVISVDGQAACTVRTLRLLGVNAWGGKIDEATHWAVLRQALGENPVPAAFMG
jgi:hypothetical protein